MGTFFTKCALCLLFVLPFSELPAQTTTDLAAFNWLEGTWQRDSKRSPVYESWTKVSARTFEGDIYTIVAGDMSYGEFLRLEQFGDEIYYTPKVAHNPFPVPFKLVKANDSEFVFENSNHDFPQRIIYRQKTNDSLFVRIEGEEDGKFNAVDFQFKRIDP